MIKKFELQNFLDYLNKKNVDQGLYDIIKYYLTELDNIRPNRIKLDRIAMTIIRDLKRYNIKNFLKDSCFYYSAGADPSPIISCLDITNQFIYCDIRVNSEFGLKRNQLLTLKSILQEQGFTQACYCLLSPDWFKLDEESYNGGFGLTTPYPTDLFKAEFSFWTKEQNFFVLIYINFDNNALWHSVFVKNKIPPKIICNFAHEDGVDYNKAQFENNMWPEFWLGHHVYSNVYKFKSHIPYFGNLGSQNERINLYKRL